MDGNNGMTGFPAARLVEALGPRREGDFVTVIPVTHSLERQKRHKLVEAAQLAQVLVTFFKLFDMCTKQVQILVNNEWQQWHEWYPCSQTCGGFGTQLRRRFCDVPPCNSLPGNNEEFRNCGSSAACASKAFVKK